VPTPAQEREPCLEVLPDRSRIRALIRVATMHTGCPVTDEDLEQEATLQIWRAIQRSPRIDYPNAFVTKIVRDTVKGYWRTRRRFDRLKPIAETALSYRQPFEDHLDQARKFKRLDHCLKRLPFKTRSVVELFYLGECSVNDLAVSLRVSRSAIKMTLLRGRRELRRMMTTNSH
jgi:RNA polymerase sigma factor (sigma-70 family)